MGYGWFKKEKKKGGRGKRSHLLAAAKGNSQSSFESLVEERKTTSDRTRGSGHKLKYRRFCLKHQETLFFTVRVTEHWHRYPREVLESPSLEIFEISVDVVLGSWPALGGYA